MSSAEEHDALVRPFMKEVYDPGNLHVAAKPLAPNFVSHAALAGEETDIEDYKRAVADQRASFPTSS
jgi:hypothetical protein